MLQEVRARRRWLHDALRAQGAGPLGDGDGAEADASLLSHETQSSASFDTAPASLVDSPRPPHAASASASGQVRAAP